MHLLGISSNKRKEYFTVERKLMKIAGISFTGNESYAYRVYSVIVLIVFLYGYPFFAALDLLKQKFSDVVDNWLYFASTLMMALVISATISNRVKLGRLLEKLQNKPYTANTNRGGDKEEKLIDAWVSFSYAQASAFAIGITLSIFSQVIYTIISRIRSSDYHDWKTGFGEINIINTTYSPNYEMVIVYQNLSMVFIAFNGCSNTLLISGIQAFLGTQFKLLQNCLKRIIYNSKQKMLQENISTRGNSPKNQDSQDSSDIPWRYFRECLKDAVSYHVDILNLVLEIEDIFSNALLTLYIGTLLILCLEVYRASLLPTFDIRTLRLLIETVSASFHSAIICYSGERMAYESEEVARAAYEINFFGADLKLQKSLVILIRASQNPIRLKAGKMIDTSVVTFAWIVRASYSAYMVLKNTNIQQK